MTPEMKYIRKLLVCELLELVDSKNTGEKEVKIEARDLKQDLEKAVDRALSHVEAEMLEIELLSEKVAARLRRSFGGAA